MVEMVKTEFCFLSVCVVMAIVSVIVFALLGVLLYQLYVPGSSYNYWKCRKGSREGHDFWFTFTAADKQASPDTTRNIPIRKVKGVGWGFLLAHIFPTHLLITFLMVCPAVIDMYYLVYACSIYTKRSEGFFCFILGFNKTS